MRERLIHERRKKRKKHGRDKSAIFIEDRPASGRTAIIVGRGRKQEEVNTKVDRVEALADSKGRGGVGGGDREFQSGRGFS